MPHQCTNCGHVFEYGSKEMLSGCPDCGGNKFQYHPGEVPEQPEDAEPPEVEGGAVSGAVGRAANRVRDAVASENANRAGVDEANAGEKNETNAGENVDAQTDVPPETRGVGGEEDSVIGEPATGDSTTGEPATGDSTTAESSGGASTGASAGTEDTAHSDDTPVPSEDSAQANARSDVVDQTTLPDPPEDGRVVKEPDDPDDRPDIESLREELNDQFESIRIVAPGQYELNLMELYDRQEYIIALQENGRYVIEVPDAWDAPESGDE